MRDYQMRMAQNWVRIEFGRLSPYRLGIAMGYLFGGFNYTCPYDNPAYGQHQFYEGVRYGKYLKQAEIEQKYGR